MDKQILREVIADQKTQQLARQSSIELIDREFLKKTEYCLRSDQILVISGIRRCGKSTLLQQIRSKQAEQDYYLNFDDERLIHFSVDDFQNLLEVFIEFYGNQKQFYFDEIQNIVGWERFVRRLHDSGHRVLITGSNASMLSKELGSHLTGRYYQIELYPFSFREFLTYFKINWQDINETNTKANLQRAFKEFMQLGGMPKYLQTQQPEYLQMLYENILYRDIVTRYNISKVKAVQELAYYTASNIGKEISFNKLKTVLHLGNASTVKEYYEYFQNSYLFFLLPKFDYSLSKQLIGNKKIYLIDTAIAKLLGFRCSEDNGRLLENIVFIELKRRNKETYYFQGNQECDFLIKEKNQITQAIQVTMSLHNEKTKEREYKGLYEAMQRHQLQQGYLLTYDEERDEEIVLEDKRCKITILPVWKWLLLP